MRHARKARQMWHEGGRVVSVVFEVVREVVDLKFGSDSRGKSSEALGARKGRPSCGTVYQVCDFLCAPQADADRELVRGQANGW